jgi:GNAT superfamily N-acetyltransferase
MTSTPSLSHGAAAASDLAEIVNFPQNADELFFCYLKADWPLSIDQLTAAMAERRDSNVVLLDGRVVCFANFYQWHHDDHCALGNLLVAPRARGHGVAHYLVTVMEQQAREHHQAKRMQVSCFNANSAGLLLYPKLGYTLSGVVERRDPQGQRVALIQFSKTL